MKPADCFFRSMSFASSTISRDREKLFFQVMCSRNLAKPSCMPSTG